MLNNFGQFNSMNSLYPVPKGTRASVIDYFAPNNAAQSAASIAQNSPVGVPNTAGAASLQTAKAPALIPFPKNSSPVTANFVINNIDTKLQKSNDTKKYNELVKMFCSSETEKTSPSDNVLRQKKLEIMLKNGTLLNKDSNDGSSVLDNIYKAATTKRLENIDGLKIAGQIIDTVYDPSIITQRFGDIPEEASACLDGKDNQYKQEASSIKYEGSGTCVAASVEFHMAHKHPAEFARWVNSLSSPKMSVEKDVNLSALSKNPMNSVWLLREFGVKPKKFDFYKAKIEISPDKNARERVKIQDKHWDNDERKVIDVLMQSTLMQLASQQTYDTLTDTKAGKFSNNPKGLIEFEKTFIESIVENSERTSLVYQNVDNDQNLIGWNCPLETLQKHITDTIDAGEDVIVGYVLTAQECNEPADNPNKIVNGHEITIIDYKQDEAGNLRFVCNDTDDDKSEYVEYSADYLLPKIHHAGYPVEIVEDALSTLGMNQAA